MKFESLVELEIYDEISQPIVVVDNKNRIIHCNICSKNFLNNIQGDSYINQDINNVMNFICEEDEIHYIDFYNIKNLKLNVTVKVNKNILFDSIISTAEVKLRDDNCRILIFSSVKLKEVFQDPLHNTIESKELLEEIDRFKHITKPLKKYSGEDISGHLARSIIAVTPTGVIIEKDGKISAINNSARDILGVTDGIGNMKDYLGKSLMEIIGEKSLEYGDKYIVEELEKSKETNAIHRKFIRKDNTVIYCEITTMYFYENNHKYFIYFLRNITNRINLWNSLINNKNVYMQMLELLTIGVMIHTNNKFCGGNKAQARILGIEDINILKTENIMDMIHEDYRKLYWDMYHNTFTTGETTELNEFKIVRKDGKIVEVEMIMTTMEYEGNKSVVILTQEITDRKMRQIDKLRLEETIKYDQLKTEFISNVSHELKTPLNIILSTAQLLQYNYRDSKDEQLKRYLNLTQTNSYRLLRLINNLIDSTRIDVGNLKMNFANYNIVKIVEDITMEAVEYVENKGLTITFDTNVEEKIIGVDKDNIERIMLNLLSNAVKFSEEGGKIIVQVLDEGDIVKIKVADNGKGISMEDQQKIFDKFVQVEQLFTRSREGSGMGLALVKSIVENHGGNIYVKSQLNRGSEFIVELPNILSKRNRFNNSHTINEMSSTEKVKIEFSDI